VKAEFRDQAAWSSKFVNARIRPTNTGTKALTGFHVYYYFTSEDSHIPQITDWHTPSVEPRLEHLGGLEYRVHYDYLSATLLQGAVIPHTEGSSVQIKYSDGALFDKSNDYSYNGNLGVWVLNPHIVVTNAGGFILFGEEPPPPFMDFDTVPGGEDEEPALELKDWEEDGLDMGFTVPGARQYTQQVGDDMYQLVNIDCFGQLTDIGTPALPSRVKYVLLPENADVNLTMSVGNSRTLDNYTIYPAQEDTTDMPEPGDESFAKDEIFYAKNTLYPENIVEIENIIHLRDKRLAVVRINPVQYNPALGQLVVHSGINFSIDFTDGDGFEPSDSASINNTINNIVLNSQGVDSPLNASPYSGPWGNMLIITPYKYKEAVDLFAIWKRQKGYDVTVKTVILCANLDMLLKLIAWRRIFNPPRAADICLYDGTTISELHTYDDDRHVQMDNGLVGSGSR
jgi:hypothetical protein